jgi:hypothetical protein
VVSRCAIHLTISNVDYSPFAQALQELAILVFLELVEEAAMYRAAFERWKWNDAEEMGIIPIALDLRRRRLSRRANALA